MYGVDVYFMACCVGIYFIVNVICMGWMFVLWLGEVVCVYFMVRCGEWGIVPGLCVVTFPLELGNFPLSFFPLSDFHLLRNLLQGRYFVFVFACGVLCFAFCLLDLCV